MVLPEARGGGDGREAVMSAAGETRRAGIVMAVLALVWGYSWIIAKIGVSLAGPFTFAALQVACGVIALGTALFVMQRRVWRGPPRGAVIVGLMQTGVFVMLNTWALSRGDPGKVSILTFTMPFWVLLIAWPVLAERVRGMQWWAVGCALAGLTLVLEPWSLRAGALSKGLALGAGVAWGVGVVLTKRAQRDGTADALEFTFWQMAVGVVPLIAVAVLAAEPAPRSGPTLIGALLFSGVVSTAAGWFMWQYVLNRLSAGTTSLSSLAVPVIAMIASALQFGERLGTTELAGAALIIVALSLVSWDAARGSVAARAAEG